MASVLHLSSHLQPTPYNRHLLPDTEQHLSLSLDLSLGGLFSKHSGTNLHLPLGSLKFPEQTIDSGITNGMAVPSPVDFYAPSTHGTHQPVNLLRTRSLQTQIRTHEARKRRKSIIYGKLHKRVKGDYFHDRDELSRSSDAEYVEFLTAGCDHAGKELQGTSYSSNETGQPLSIPNGTDPEFTTDVVACYAHPLENGSMTDVFSAQPVHSMPIAPMVDYMNVLVSSEKDFSTSVNHVATSQPDYCASSVLPSEVDGGDKGVNVNHVLNVHQSSLSCTSSGYSHLTSCSPYASRQAKGPIPSSLSNSQTAPSTRVWHSDSAQCYQVVMPTRGSSNHLQFWQAGELSDSRQNGDKHGVIERSCNSSSSEVGNQSVNIEKFQHEPVEVQGKGYRDEEHVDTEQVHRSVTMPGMSMAYPHLFPVLPLPYPYGIPLPWGFPLPWIMQGPAQDAFAVGAVCAPQSMVQNEVLAPSIPFSGFSNPYNIPVVGSNIPPWIPVGPSGAGSTITALDNAFPAPSNIDLRKMLSSGYSKNDLSGFVQNEPGVESPSMEDNGMAKYNGLVENQEPCHVMANEPVGESDTFLPIHKSIPMQPEKECTSGDSTVSRESVKNCKGQSKRALQTLSEKFVAAGRQQSLPLQEDQKTPPKKKKVVRFNSLNVEVLPPVMTVDGEASGSSDDHTPEQCPDVHLTCNQADVKLPNSIEHLRNDMLPSSCADASWQNSSCTKEDLNIYAAGDGHSADDTIHSENTVTCKMDKGNVGEASAVNSGPCKIGDSKSRVGSCFSLANLPRVSTRGCGPNVKTIHGVMYITKDKQARLICVCHGKHMSPLEFVQHSGSNDLSNPARSIVLEAFPYVDHAISVPA